MYVFEYVYITGLHPRFNMPQYVCTCCAIYVPKLRVGPAKYLRRRAYQSLHVACRECIRFLHPSNESAARRHEDHYKFAADAADVAAARSVRCYSYVKGMERIGL